MDDYMTIVDAIRQEAEENPPTIRVEAMTSGSLVFDVVIEGNARS